MLQLAIALTNLDASSVIFDCSFAENMQKSLLAIIPTGLVKICSKSRKNRHSIVVLAAGISSAWEVVKVLNLERQ